MRPVQREYVFAAAAKLKSSLESQCRAEREKEGLVVKLLPEVMAENPMYRSLSVLQHSYLTHSNFELFVPRMRLRDLLWYHGYRYSTKKNSVANRGI